ncbi:MAG: NAD-dependent protein deacetylase [Gemmatimonadales bacterium]|nr:MAG: NAD-dependent protein deacetylase [Gemmatimonadales bacterium]
MPEGPPPGPAPEAAPTADPSQIEALARFIRHRRPVVLTGAGCSTESGIPDYRGPAARNRDRQPMLYQEFTRSPEARSRYWARSSVGWVRFRESRPNPAHGALADLEGSGAIPGIISQNVDGLHQAAGSRRVLELHGSLARVRCLGCGGDETREDLHHRLRTLNPHFPLFGADAHLLADGDAALPEDAHRGFQPAPCLRCGGILKPDVVFFGESVPRSRLEDAWGLYGQGRGLLVVGSSLTVFSGRRFVRKALAEGRPVAIVNLGPTLSDDAAELKVEDRVGRLLPRVVAALNGPGATRQGRG